MIGYNRAIGLKHDNSCANQMVIKIINPLTCFGSLLSHLQRQYDVCNYKKKFFSYKLIHFSEPPPLINGNYIKTNSNNNLKCIKIIKK